MNFENNRLHKEIKSISSFSFPSENGAKNNETKQKCDHFHILRIVSNKLSMLSSYITSTFNLILEINKDTGNENLINIGKGLKDGIHVIQGLIEKQS